MEWTKELLPKAATVQVKEIMIRVPGFHTTQVDTIPMDRLRLRPWMGKERRVYVSVTERHGGRQGDRYTVGYFSIDAGKPEFHPARVSWKSNENVMDAEEILRDMDPADRERFMAEGAKLLLSDPAPKKEKKPGKYPQRFARDRAIRESAADVRSETESDSFIGGWDEADLRNYDPTKEEVDETEFSEPVTGLTAVYYDKESGVREFRNAYGIRERHGIWSPQSGQTGRTVHFTTKKTYHLYTQKFSDGMRFMLIGPGTQLHGRLTSLIDGGDSEHFSIEGVSDDGKYRLKFEQAGFGEAALTVARNEAI